MRTAIIETAELTRNYGDIVAVDNLNLHVELGQVFGFLGPNGAGKTTTIRLLLGLIRADSGQVRLAGHDLAKNPRAALSRTGSIVETPALYPHLSGAENLAITCHIRGIAKSDISRVLDVVDLGNDARRRVKEYSLGMRQRLGIARALLGDPQLLILDEPTNGLDPAGIREIRQLIADAPNRFGTTILVSSHLLGEVQNMASHVGVMSRGKLLFQGTLADLLASAPPRLNIRVNKARAAQAHLAEAGLESSPADDGLILQGIARADIAEINRRLVEAGFDVSGLELKPPALEDIFLQLTDQAK